MRNNLQDPEREKMILDVLSDTNISFNVPAHLTKPNELVIELKNHLQYRKKDGYNRKGLIHTKGKVFDTTVSPSNFDRTFRILDTFIKASLLRGHQFAIEDDKTFIVIDSEKLQIRFWEKSKVAENDMKDSLWQTRDLEPSGLLFIHYIDFRVESQWGDTNYTTLEEKLARVLGSLEFIGKKEKEKAIEWEIRRKKREEEERIKEGLKAKRNKELADFKILLNDSERWTKAQHLRQYINHIETNSNNHVHLHEDIHSWIQWAKAKADWYDPLIKKPDELLSDIKPNEL